MGCGLRKLEDPEHSSPGKIYSTLKRPQVETKTDTVYEYTMLDFTLEGTSNPAVLRIGSLQDLPSELEQYYRKGFVLTAFHPIVLSVGRRRHLPISLLYRAVLARPQPNSKHASPAVHSTPRLLVEEWLQPGDTLSSDVVRGLLDKVNSCAQRGLRFLGFVPQQGGGALRSCNGGGPCSRGSPSGLSCESVIEDEKPPEYGGFNEGGGSPQPSHRREEIKLFALFHSWDSAYPAWLARDEDVPSWTYHQGALSMKVTRKGQTISMLEADWLALTTAYYKKGWSLVDSFVYWETPKGEPVPRSLEGLFVYEERGASTAPPTGNDTIIVEQWTVIEGCDVKSDYGPLVHTLAEFGWLLTCVLPTPLIRHDSEGNLATKQVVFLQRAMRDPAPSEKRTPRSPRSEDDSVHTASRGVGGARCDDLTGGFPRFGGYPSALRDLEEGGFEQEEVAAEVTCM
ncbi:raftlin-2-like isoform X1 [Polyodon spathula]|uniref:raftlin-2-like isoform X1 n=1 Tax=Polyodon spathula TaxID=7913 RepID=UPI001B7F57BD|nr:raftlin-2-like isoform X1 [Polyodon spathula]XP_041118230.1 raftlin-2-like isoform X1 [Polyodon spathula]XP_041118231.1 raftlin-2-like isoform X1 [Polyodon spathula]XP_041118233.1 raftlin-2-like isoform X1 [Polyodon spathula]